MIVGDICTQPRIASPPLLFSCGASQEWKLQMAVLLQALAERDPANVTCDYRHGTEYHKVFVEQQCKRSKDYVDSKDFSELCSIIGVDATFLRSLTPEKAKVAYYKLMRGEQNGDAREIREDNDDS